jgi:hypothetical protein
VTETSGCSQHGHPEFRIHYDDSLIGEDDLKYLIESLERAVAEGANFEEDGTDLQIGWIVNRLRKNDKGSLTIQEPDMTHTPEWWIDSVNHCLVHRRLQRGVCVSVVGGDRVDFPSSRQKASLCERFGDADLVVMRRGGPENDHSGWVFGCGGDDHDCGDPATSTTISLYEVVVGYEPKVMPYLALPQGVAVELRRDGPVVTLDGQRLPFRRGSMLFKNFPGDES